MGDDSAPVRDVLAQLGPKARALAWLEGAQAFSKLGPGQKPPCQLGFGLAWLKPQLLVPKM